MHIELSLDVSPVVFHTAAWVIVQVVRAWLARPQGDRVR